MLPAHRPRRNFGPLLLLVLGLLAGCRAERVAFRFQPNNASSRGGTVEPLRNDTSVAAKATEVSEAQHSIRQAWMDATLIRFEKKDRPANLARRHVAEGSAANPKKASSALRATVRTATLANATQAKTDRQTTVQAAPSATDKGWGWLLLILVVLGLLVLSGIGWGLAAVFNIGFWRALGYFGLFILVLFSIGIVGELFFGW